jgi:hypothetical protein
MADRFDPVAASASGDADAALVSRGPAVALDVQARVVGSYQWIERRLFEVLGSWVASEPVPDAQVLFDVYSQQHAWHGELFADRLPALDSVDPATLVVPPDRDVERMLGVLSGVVHEDDRADDGAADSGHVIRGQLDGVPAGGTLPRLVGVGRVVLPRLVSGYTLHLRRLSAVADAPLIRTLRLVLRDEVEQWQTVESLTQTLLRRPHDVVVVSDHQQRLEAIIAQSGAGLVPWPALSDSVDAPSGSSGPGS